MIALKKEVKVVKSDILYKTKCELAGCKNLAKIMIKDEIDSKKKIELCDECLENIAKVYLKSKVPKGIKAPFKNQKKI